MASSPLTVSSLYWSLTPFAVSLYGAPSEFVTRLTRCCLFASGAFHRPFALSGRLCGSRLAEIFFDDPVSLLLAKVTPLVVPEGTKKPQNIGHRCSLALTVEVGLLPAVLALPLRSPADSPPMRFCKTSWICPLATAGELEGASGAGSHSVVTLLA
jgi:hypothetical protein